MDAARFGGLWKLPGVVAGCPCPCACCCPCSAWLDSPPPSLPAEAVTLSVASPSAGEAERTGESPCCPACTAGAAARVGASWGMERDTGPLTSCGAAAAAAAGVLAKPPAPRDPRLLLLPPAPPAMLPARLLSAPDRSHGLGLGFILAAAGAASGLGGLSLISVCSRGMRYSTVGVARRG